MSATLAAWVHLLDPDGTAVSFGPGSAPPEWAARKITNPKAWTDGQVPTFDHPDADPVAVTAQEPATEPPTDENAPAVEPTPDDDGAGADASASGAGDQQEPPAEAQEPATEPVKPARRRTSRNSK